MRYEFRSKTLHGAVRQAVAHPCERKITAEVWAPPLFWSGWFRLEDIWLGGGYDVVISLAFDAIGNVPSPFAIEFADGAAKSSPVMTTGPGSVDYTIIGEPDGRASVTALHARAKSFSVGQVIDVQVTGRETHPHPNPNRTTQYYIWRTQRDGDVRPSHAANEGRIFSWNNPPPTGHPGEDYGCRCYAEPIDT